MIKSLPAPFPISQLTKELSESWWYLATYIESRPDDIVSMAAKSNKTVKNNIQIKEITNKDIMCT
jgi:hypothetical protein